MSKLFPRTAAAAATALLLAGPAGAVTIASDLEFAAGDTPVGGTTELDGVTVTLATTNAEVNNETSLRDVLNDTEPATFLFSFSEPIETFTVNLGAVLPERDVLTGFTAFPSEVNGDLVLDGGEVTGVNAGDVNFGNIVFDNLNESSVGFTVENRPVDGEPLAVSVLGFTATTIEATPDDGGAVDAGADGGDGDSGDGDAGDNGGDGDDGAGGDGNVASVPSPTAAGLGLMLLAGAAVRRRR